MHPYSIDKNLRSMFSIAIFIASMIISILVDESILKVIQNILGCFKNDKINRIVDLLKWLDINFGCCGVIFWYNLLAWSYDKYLWKTRIFMAIHQIPNMNGHWVGSLKSSASNDLIPMEMNITQTWTEISFCSIFKKTNSCSYSNVAAIYNKGYSEKEICFAFKNESFDIDSNMQVYYGYNILTLVDEKIIWARYCNDRQNPNSENKGGNKGVFYLERLNKV